MLQFSIFVSGERGSDQGLPSAGHFPGVINPGRDGLATDGADQAAEVAPALRGLLGEAKPSRLDLGTEDCVGQDDRRDLTPTDPASGVDAFDRAGPRRIGDLTSTSCECEILPCLVIEGLPCPL